MLSKSAVIEALNGVAGEQMNLAEHLEWVAVLEDHVSVRLHLPGVSDQVALTQLAGEADRAIRDAARDAGNPVRAVRVTFVNEAGDEVFAAGQDKPPAGGPGAGQPRATPPPRSPAPSQAPNPQQGATALEGITHAIAVGAGKGGVGKSTVAVNLAVGLAQNNNAVGLCDGDIYGPSLPTLLGLDAMEQQVIDGVLQPFNVHGIKAVTIGKLVDADKPLIWRGPMAHGAFNQLVSKTRWGELDHLIVDLPPGTGDVPLTLAQSLQLAGAVIVCTPQKVAQDDAVRAARMFQQLGVDILGVVENMSYFVGDDGKEYDIFGRGGAELMAQRMNLPYLGAIPINMALRANSDAGDPARNFAPETAGGEALPKALRAVVRNLESQLALATLRKGSSRPKLNIS